MVMATTRLRIVITVTVSSGYNMGADSYSCRYNMVTNGYGYNTVTGGYGYIMVTVTTPVQMVTIVLTVNK